jgi:hypothetical protein
LLTQGATIHIFTDVGAKARPPKIPLNKFFCFEMAGVTHHGMIVKPAEEVMTGGGGNISMVFVIQNRIKIFQSDNVDFMGGRQRPLNASEAVEKIGSDKGSSVAKASQRELSRSRTNIVSGRRVTSVLSESVV